MSPKIWLPLLTAVWGILTMCLGFVSNFASFVTVRALLGVAEGGLLPGMVSRMTLGYLSDSNYHVLRFCTYPTSTAAMNLLCGSEFSILQPRFLELLEVCWLED
jgi:MFS family permease